MGQIDKDSLWALGVTTVLAALIGLVLVSLDAYNCQNRATLMGFSYSWGPVQGCMIETPQGVVPIGSYRVMAE